MVEYRSPKPVVAGSSPAAPANQINYLAASLIEPIGSADTAHIRRECVVENKAERRGLNISLVIPNAVCTDKEKPLA